MSPSSGKTREVTTVNILSLQPIKELSRTRFYGKKGCTGQSTDTVAVELGLACEFLSVSIGVYCRESCFY